MMNTVLSEILKTGTTPTADGMSTCEVRDAVSWEEGEFLQDIVRKVDPTVSLEVGLAQGFSTLFICAALNVARASFSSQDCDVLPIRVAIPASDFACGSTDTMGSASHSQWLRQSRGAER
jgi:hypothetical protein